MIGEAPGDGNIAKAGSVPGAEGTLKAGSVRGTEGTLKAGSVRGTEGMLKAGSMPEDGNTGVWFRPAVKADIPEITALIRAAVDAMEAQGIFQWDSIYPSEAVFLDDAEKGQLFAVVDAAAKGAAAKDTAARGAAAREAAPKDAAARRAAPRNVTAERTGGAIAAVYVVNCECDEQYRNAGWKGPEDSFRVIHRLCVHPMYQHRGLGKEILDHIEADLRCQGVQAIRLDVFSRNPYALALYRNQGYTMTGTADWRKGRFFLMEKLL